MMASLLSRSSLFAANPITIGLLLYIAFFQMVIYRSHGESDFALHARATSIALRPPLEEVETTQRQGGVGVWPRHPVVPPRNPVEWKPYSSEPTKVPYPIFVTSLPKSGTTSIWKYFRCGGQESSHNWITKRGARKASLAGQCIEKNIKKGKPPFENCGENDVFTDTGVSNRRAV